MTPLVGYHLTADGSGITRQPGALALFVHQALEATRMTPIAPLWVSEKEDRAFQIIAESHISVHLAGDCGWIDIFSCRRFDEKKAARLIRTAFGGTWRHQFRSRGFLTL